MAHPGRPSARGLPNQFASRPPQTSTTPAQVRAKLEEYRAIGLDEVVIGGADDAASIAAALKAARG